MGKSEIIDRVVDKELKMFTSVKADQPVSCQDDADGFKVFRSAQFQAWSEGTLVSYLNDLEKAESEGLNLMTMKYARMERKIPSIHENPQVIQMIGEMVAIQAGWQKEMIQKYPSVMARGRPIDELSNTAAMTSFKKYLSCELETYSQMTLTHLFRDIMNCYSTGNNMSAMIYETMVKNLGYESLVAAEEEISCR
ncbi:hypothetical protein DSCA_19390 [Desulfosarcina alkanivorans]|uniref:DUF4125 domain-containing protein n=1 Tax=Desulfosarcina alkanivorans TaxID=571177 RepID=A0A5K7YJK3_9BACT|nr:DUF4125 family protein [Desulfosarcina alkanivorans]BBO68009.1 hypothetical protein DSCA_19390 [Desulfosarcina alkanivorans]